MATVKQHLAAHHTKSAAFDLSVATEVDRLRKAFEALEGNADAGDAMKKSFSDAKSSVARLGELFSEHARYHRDAGQSVAKGDDADDLSKLQPLGGISGVTDPSRAPATGRLVPRSGQPTRDIPQVDTRFEHLVKVDD